MLEILRRPEADNLNVYPGAIPLQGEVRNDGILPRLQYGRLPLHRPALEAELIELLLNGAIKYDLRIRFYAEKRSSGVVQSEVIDPLSLERLPGYAGLQAPPAGLHQGGKQPGEGRAIPLGQLEKGERPLQGDLAIMYGIDEAELLDLPENRLVVVLHLNLHGRSPEKKSLGQR